MMRLILLITLLIFGACESTTDKEDEPSQLDNSSQQEDVLEAEKELAEEEISEQEEEVKKAFDSLPTLKAANEGEAVTFKLDMGAYVDPDEFELVSSNENANDLDEDGIAFLDGKLVITKAYMNIGAFRLSPLKEEDEDTKSLKKKLADYEKTELPLYQAINKLIDEGEEKTTGYSINFEGGKNSSPLQKALDKRSKKKNKELAKLLTRHAKKLRLEREHDPYILFNKQMVFDFIAGEFISPIDELKIIPGEYHRLDIKLSPYLSKKLDSPHIGRTIILKGYIAKKDRKVPFTIYSNEPVVFSWRFKTPITIEAGSPSLDIRFLADLWFHGVELEDLFDKKSSLKDLKLAEKTELLIHRFIKNFAFYSHLYFGDTKIPTMGKVDNRYNHFYEVREKYASDEIKAKLKALREKVDFPVGYTNAMDRKKEDLLGDLPDPSDNTNTNDNNVAHLVDAKASCFKAKVHEGYIDHPARDQTCGTCWIFSTIGAAEINYLHQGLEPPDLSEQQVAECGPEFNACDGGIIGDAMEYLLVDGTGTESWKPFEKSQGDNDKSIACRSGQPPVLYKGKQHDFAIPNTVAAIKKAICRYGSVAANFYKPDDFENYVDHYGGKCGKYKQESGHAVVIVGWEDGDKKGTGNWQIRNSWGIDNHVNGYFTMPYECQGIGLHKVNAIQMSPPIDNSVKPKKKRTKKTKKKKRKKK